MIFHTIWRKFEEARAFANSLKLEGKDEWEKYAKEKGLPEGIPSRPDSVYRNKGWISWRNWIGKEWLSFSQAREFARSSGIKNSREWEKYAKEKGLPEGIPRIPHKVYKNKGWISWGNFLGTGTVWKQDFKPLPFEEAREFARSSGIKNNKEWRKYVKEKDLPEGIPPHPERTYKKEWISWGDWFGTGTIATQDRKYWSFLEAKKFVHSLGFKNTKEYNKWSRSGEKPDYIPYSPNRVYKKEWKGWGDWLGTGTIATQDRKYWSFLEAKKFVHSLGLKSWQEWRKWCRSGEKPDYIPTNANIIYEEVWKGWYDFLGYEETDWSIRRVKELLKDWIESGMLYEEDEIVLYHLLSTKGLLNLQSRHTQFFKNLIEARRTAEGRKTIEEYVNSDLEIPPDLSEEEEIGTASSQEIADLVGKETDPLDYGKIKTPQQIFAQSDRLESYTEDIESMQFYVNKSIKDLWASAFRDKENTISDVRREGKDGNKYHDIILETFLSDYEGAQSIEIPKGYTFRDKDKEILSPTLMQRYVAYKIKTNRRFGNFSGTGAGKTLSAVLASRVIDSKMTLIICPNDVVDQWENNILEIFHDSVVITRNEAFYEKYDKNKHKYLVLNYDLFSQPYSPNLILNLVKQKIDFVVLDEIHFTKKRNEKEESKRRHNIEGLMTDVSKKNSYVNVLGLSATPVINELEEGKSLLQLITGKIYDDISTRPTPQNAVKLYEKLSLISIREIPPYPISVYTEHIDVEIDIRKSNISAKELIRNPLTVERLASDAKIPEIIKHIQGTTIIYTEYVTDIVEKLSKAVEDAGYTYAKYTGEDHSGLKRFLDKKVQVLIASRPISTGVDGLQHICNNLIINTLPWTNAQYQQTCW